MSNVFFDTVFSVFGKRKNQIQLLQIGANDGVFLDPVEPLLKLHSDLFSAVHSYEPIPDFYTKLVENKKCYDFVITHNLAVTADEIPSVMLNYIPWKEIVDNRLPGSSQGIGSIFTDRNSIGGIGELAP